MNLKELNKWIDRELKDSDDIRGHEVGDEFTDGYDAAWKSLREIINDKKIIK